MNLLEENEVKITKQRSMRNIFLIGNKVLAQSKRWESPREADLHCQWEVGRFSAILSALIELIMLQQLKFISHIKAVPNSLPLFHENIPTLPLTLGRHRANNGKQFSHNNP